MLTVTLLEKNKLGLAALLFFLTSIVCFIPSLAFLFINCQNKRKNNTSKSNESPKSCMGFKWTTRTQIKVVGRANSFAAGSLLTIGKLYFPIILLLKYINEFKFVKKLVHL